MISDVATDIVNVIIENIIDEIDKSVNKITKYNTLAWHQVTYSPQQMLPPSLVAIKLYKVLILTSAGASLHC